MNQNPVSYLLHITHSELYIDFKIPPNYKFIELKPSKINLKNLQDSTHC